MVVWICLMCNYRFSRKRPLPSTRMALGKRHLGNESILSLLEGDQPRGENKHHHNKHRTSASMVGFSVSDGAFFSLRILHLIT